MVVRALLASVAIVALIGLPTYIAALVNQAMGEDRIGTLRWRVLPFRKAADSRPMRALRQARAVRRFTDSLSVTYRQYRRRVGMALGGMVVAAFVLDRTWVGVQAAGDLGTVSILLAFVAGIAGALSVHGWSNGMPVRVLLPRGAIGTLALLAALVLTVVGVSTSEAGVNDASAAGRGPGVEADVMPTTPEAEPTATEASATPEVDATELPEVTPTATPEVTESPESSALTQLAAVDIPDSDWDTIQAGDVRYEVPKGTACLASTFPGSLIKLSGPLRLYLGPLTDNRLVVQGPHGVPLPLASRDVRICGDEQIEGRLPDQLTANWALADALVDSPEGGQWSADEGMCLGISLKLRRAGSSDAVYAWVYGTAPASAIVPVTTLRSVNSCPVPVP